MSFEKKISKDLDRYSEQWEDAIRPDVERFGRQADKRIQELEEALQEVIDRDPVADSFFNLTEVLKGKKA